MCVGLHLSGNASALETCTSYLRHQVDESGPPLIHAARGVGYSLRLPPESAEIPRQA